MTQILFAVAFTLMATLSSQAQHVSIRFSPASEQFAEATRAYQALWEAEGPSMIAALERVSGLQFPERAMEVIVYEGISWAGAVGSPMRMRASYPPETKKATLIHELGHRHLAQLQRRPSELG